MENAYLYHTYMNAYKKSYIKLYTTFPSSFYVYIKYKNNISYNI